MVIVHLFVDLVDNRVVVWVLKLPVELLHSDCGFCLLELMLPNGVRQRLFGLPNLTNLCTKTSVEVDVCTRSRLQITDFLSIHCRDVAKKGNQGVKCLGSIVPNCL